MQLAGWIRERLWKATHWVTELGNLRKVAGTDPERLFDLANATEQCDPDRAHALARYLEASRAGHAHARIRARALATSMGQHLTVAELALEDRDPLAAGEAFLDAGFPELAVDPLKGVIELQRAGVLFAYATRQNVNAEAEIARSLAQAKQVSGRAAVPAYAHAARIAALGKLEPRLVEVLFACGRACIDDDAAAALIEARLYDANRIDELLAHFRDRFERAPTPAQSVERMRAAGAGLLSRGLQPGLALRMLRMSLESSYVARLGDIPCHVATWEALYAHAQASQTTLELVPLIVQALASPLSDDVALYLSRLGLEIVWRDGKDTLAAQPYAATVLDFVPDHPLAAAFIKEITGEMKPTALKAPVAPAPALPPKPPRRISTEDAPVKRSPSIPIPKPTGITGRLALLQPPPPRATSLKRDTSPFPMSRRPNTPTQNRAPRKVVPVDAVVQLPSGQVFATVLRDVSTSGAFVMTKRPIEVDQVIKLEMRVPLPGKLSQQTLYRTTARIARVTEVGCGLAFVDASPELVAALRATTE